MKTISVEEAVALLQDIRNMGCESYTVVAEGRPVVTLVPVAAAPEKRPLRLGFMEGEIVIPDDFDTMFQTGSVRTSRAAPEDA